MIERALKFLVRFKNDLKKVNVVEASRKASLDPDWVNPLVNDEDGGLGCCRPVVDDDDEDDGEPLTWAEQKNVRKELRRFLTWQALRVRIPRGLEGLE